MTDQRPKFPVPQTVPLENVSPEVRNALNELVALAINEHTPLMNFDLNDITNSETGFPLGSYRITIERTR